MNFIIEHGALILSFLLALSEVLALIPAVKSNSIFGLIVGFMKSIKDSVATKPEVEAPKSEESKSEEQK